MIKQCYILFQNLEKLINPELINKKNKSDKNNTICKEDSLKELKTLIHIFWSKSMTENQE